MLACSLALYSSPAKILFPKICGLNWHRPGMKNRKLSKFRRSTASRARPICADFFSKKIVSIFVTMVTRGRSQGKHTNAALPFALRISDVAWFFGVACPTGTAEVAHTSLFLSAVTDVAYVLRWYRFYSRLWDGARSEVGWRLSFFPIACRARRRRRRHTV